MTPNDPGQDQPSVAGGLTQYAEANRPEALRKVPLEELVAELLGRTREGAFATESTILLGCQIQDALRSGLDIHCNRLSARRYRDMFGMFDELRLNAAATLDGATVVDLGCGSLNPYGLLFLYLMLGAKRGIAVDLDPIQDEARAVRALADCAGAMLTDPTELVGDYPITREQVLRNVASFDFTKLRAGDPAGLDPERLCLRLDSVFALPLGDGEADLVLSNALFEHIPQVDQAIAELARITRKGGYHIHSVDGADHRRYGDPQCHPLEFLTERGEAELTRGSNRLRPTEFIDRFERQGFELVAFTPFETVELDPALRGRLVEPFRSMPDEVLRVIGGRLHLRRT